MDSQVEEHFGIRSQYCKGFHLKAWFRQTNSCVLHLLMALGLKKQYVEIGILCDLAPLTV